MHLLYILAKVTDPIFTPHVSQMAHKHELIKLFGSLSVGALFGRCEVMLGQEKVMLLGLHVL